VQRIATLHFWVILQNNQVELVTIKDEIFLNERLLIKTLPARTSIYISLKKSGTLNK
jgi:hypothetical protein